MTNLAAGRQITDVADFLLREEQRLEASETEGKDAFTRLAVLTQYLHNNGNPEILAGREEALETIKEYSGYRMSCWGEAGHSKNILEEAVTEYGLFDDFYDVPFPNPQRGGRAFIDLFAGIGGIRLPFSELGWQCVFSSEWDKYAQQTYLANFGEMPFGDITKESTKKYIPERFDLLLAGFPCQAFSIMGKMKGFEDTRGTMFFEVATILERHRPEAVLLENVKQLTTHDGGKTFSVILNTLAGLGYHVKWSVLNALDFGLPQKRERVIIVGFLSKKRSEMFNFDFEKKPYSLNTILEPEENVDPSLLVSERILSRRKSQTEGKRIFYPSIWHENKAGNVSVLDYSCALRTGASYNYLLVNGRRRPTSRELLRLQGFPDSYRIAVPHSEIRRQTGNSVAVPMIRMIAAKIDKLLNE